MVKIACAPMCFRPQGLIIKAIGGDPTAALND